MLKRTEEVMYRYGRMVDSGTDYEWLWLSTPRANRTKVELTRREAVAALGQPYRLFRQTTTTTLEEIDSDDEDTPPPAAQ